MARTHLLDLNSSQFPKFACVCVIIYYFESFVSAFEFWIGSENLLLLAELRMQIKSDLNKMVFLSSGSIA